MSSAGGPVPANSGRKAFLHARMSSNHFQPKGRGREAQPSTIPQRAAVGGERLNAAWLLPRGRRRAAVLCRDFTIHNARQCFCPPPEQTSHLQTFRTASGPFMAFGPILWPRTWPRAHLLASGPSPGLGPISCPRAHSHMASGPTPTPPTVHGPRGFNHSSEQLVLLQGLAQSEARPTWPCHCAIMATNNARTTGIF